MWSDGEQKKENREVYSQSALHFLKIPNTEEKGPIEVDGTNSEFLKIMQLIVEYLAE
jgi:hypothetical protein